MISERRNMGKGSGPVGSYQAVYGGGDCLGE
jgi:hypothetical protein